MVRTRGEMNGLKRLVHGRMQVFAEGPQRVALQREKGGTVSFAWEEELIAGEMNPYWGYPRSTVALENCKEPEKCIHGKELCSRVQKKEKFIQALT